MQQKEKQYTIIFYNSINGEQQQQQKKTKRKLLFSSLPYRTLWRICGER